MKTNIHFFIIFRSVLLKIRNISEKSGQKNQTQNLGSITFSENRAVNEITWKNIV